MPRPKRKENLVKVWLRKSVYAVWKSKKELAGYGNNTNSEFAEYLLHRETSSRPHDGISRKRRRDEKSLKSDDVSPVSYRRPLFESTPSRAPRRQVQQHKAQLIPPSTSKTSEVDVTGVSEIDNIEIGSISERSATFRKCQTVNEYFASIPGNPFGLSSVDSGSSSCDDDSDSEEFSRLTFILNQSDNSDETDFDDDIDNYSDSCEVIDIADTESASIDEFDINETTLTASFVSIDNDDDATLPHRSNDEQLASPEDVFQISPEGGEPSVIQASVDDNVVPPPVSVSETRGEGDEPVLSDSPTDFSAKLQEVFNDLLLDKSLSSFEEVARKEKVVVTLDKILELFKGPCNVKDCSRSKEVWHKSQGGVLVVGWNCGGGHGDLWKSSDVLIKKEQGQKVYVNTVVLAASILLTGCNFGKVALLTKCLNLGFISHATFDRIQKLYAIPAVQEVWSNMKKVIHKVMEDEKLVLSGDGKNDSPGFSAQYCVYSLMEEITKVIVDIEVKDKRETGGSSTAMEVAALKTLLERLIQSVSIGEITTDASTSVMAMVKKLKGNPLPHISPEF